MLKAKPAHPRPCTALLGDTFFLVGMACSSQRNAVGLISRSGEGTCRGNADCSVGVRSLGNPTEGNDRLLQVDVAGGRRIDFRSNKVDIKISTQYGMVLLAAQYKTPDNKQADKNARLRFIEETKKFRGRYPSITVDRKAPSLK